MSVVEVEELTPEVQMHFLKEFHKTHHLFIYFLFYLQAYVVMERTDLLLSSMNPI
uniref:Uncharacterized protein n=1 Tax=Anguilla anguilla TaxID=7936 RepID=A0A0E9X7P0_ANGAN